MSAGGEDRRRRSERRRAGAAGPARETASAGRSGSRRGQPAVLSRGQLDVVDALRAAGVLSVSEIAEAIGASRSVATIRVEELVLLGVVDRRMDPEDRRRRQVRLTAAWRPERARGSGSG